MTKQRKRNRTVPKHNKINHPLQSLTREDSESNKHLTKRLGKTATLKFHNHKDIWIKWGKMRVRSRGQDSIKKATNSTRLVFYRGVKDQIQIQFIVRRRIVNKEAMRGWTCDCSWGGRRDRRRRGKGRGSTKNWIATDWRKARRLCWQIFWRVMWKGAAEASTLGKK